jgi:hypothetical protein
VHVHVHVHVRVHVHVHVHVLWVITVEIIAKKRAPLLFFAAA